MSLAETESAMPENLPILKPLLLYLAGSLAQVTMLLQDISSWLGVLVQLVSLVSLVLVAITNFKNLSKLRK